MHNLFIPGQQFVKLLHYIFPVPVSLKNVMLKQTLKSFCWRIDWMARSVQKLQSFSSNLRSPPSPPTILLVQGDSSCSQSQSQVPTILRPSDSLNWGSTHLLIREQQIEYTHVRRWVCVCVWGGAGGGMGGEGCVSSWARVGLYTS